MHWLNYMKFLEYRLTRDNNNGDIVALSCIKSFTCKCQQNHYVCQAESAAGSVAFLVSLIGYKQFSRIHIIVIYLITKMTSERTFQMFRAVTYLMYVTVRIDYSLSAATAVGVGRYYTRYNTIEE